jgi:hypothetical protein
MLWSFVTFTRWRLDLSAPVEEAVLCVALHSGLYTSNAYTHGLSSVQVGAPAAALVAATEEAEATAKAELRSILLLQAQAAVAVRKAPALAIPSLSLNQYPSCWERRIPSFK